jgi:hypothetical protein
MNELKEVIKEIFEKNSDGITFLPTPDLDIDIKGFDYTKKSKYDVHELGHYYHIMIYKTDYDGFATHTDNFTAILTDPHVYVSNIIMSGFYGVVVKKNKISNKFINDVYKKVIEATKDGKKGKTKG